MTEGLNFYDEHSSSEQVFELLQDKASPPLFTADRAEYLAGAVARLTRDGLTVSLSYRSGGRLLCIRISDLSGSHELFIVTGDELEIALRTLARADAPAWVRTKLVPFPRSRSRR